MATFIIILILCTITAAVTFIVTRSLYIHRFTDWYRKAMDIDNMRQGEVADSIYAVLAKQYWEIKKIDPSIIPDHIKRIMDIRLSWYAKLQISDECRAARWLGYDLTLTKRPMDPPPPFKHPTPKNLKQELVECWEAEGRLEEN